MQVNYLDVGGSDFIVFKINEVKDYFLGQKCGSGLVFQSYGLNFDLFLG